MMELVDHQKGYAQGWDGESMDYPAEPKELPGFVGLEYYAIGFGYV